MYKFSIKRFVFMVVTVLVIATMLNGSVFAAATSKSLSTNYTLVNLGTASAAVDVNYILNGGTWDVDSGNKSFNLDPNGGQKQIRQYFDNTMASGSGSAVVSSSQPLAAVVQIQARGQDPTSGAYIGVSEGSDTFYVPLVARRGFGASGAVNSQIIIQNAGTGSVNFTITLTPNKGYGAVAPKAINGLAAGNSYYYDLETDSAIPDGGWFGSAVVSTTSGSLVVVSNLFTGADGLQAYNAFPKSVLTNAWVAPIFTSRLGNGLSTVVTMQNLSGGTLAAGTVALNCKRTGESTVSIAYANPEDIEDNASYSFNPVTNTSVFPAEYAGSCVLSAPAGKNIVTFVQMRYVNVGDVANAAAYEAIPANQTSTSFYIPLMAKRLGNSFATVANIANLSSSENTVDLIYTPSATECPVAACDVNKDGKVDTSDTVTVSNMTIPGNGGLQRNLRQPTGSSDPSTEQNIPDLWVGSLKVVSKSGLPIGGIVQLTNLNLVKGDSLMAHDAFAQ